MKLKVSKGYLRRLLKVLKSTLNGGNLVQGVNNWEVPLLRYSAALISWRKCELQAIDRETRRLFATYEGLFKRYDAWMTTFLTNLYFILSKVSSLTLHSLSRNSFTIKIKILLLFQKVS